MFRTIFGSFIETAVGKKPHLLSLVTIHQYVNKRLEEVQDAWRPSAPVPTLSPQRDPP